MFLYISLSISSFLYCLISCFKQAQVIALVYILICSHYDQERNIVLTDHSIFNGMARIFFKKAEMEAEKPYYDIFRWYAQMLRAGLLVAPPRVIEQNDFSRMRYFRHGVSAQKLFHC